MHLLATAPSDYAISLWPLWSAWLLAVLALLFARPTRVRRTLGIAWLGLGLAFYSWEIYFRNGCFEGYAEWTSCEVGIVLMGASAVIALLNLRR